MASDFSFICAADEADKIILTLIAINFEKIFITDFIQWHKHEQGNLFSIYDTSDINVIVVYPSYSVIAQTLVKQELACCARYF